MELRSDLFDFFFFVPTGKDARGIIKDKIQLIEIMERDLHRCRQMRKAEITWICRWTYKSQGENTKKVCVNIERYTMEMVCWHVRSQ